MNFGRLTVGWTNYHDVAPGWTNYHDVAVAEKATKQRFFLESLVDGLRVTWAWITKE